MLVGRSWSHETDTMDQWMYFWILIQTGYISLMSSPMCLSAQASSLDLDLDTLLHGYRTLCTPLP